MALKQQGRLGDLSRANSDAHGCPACPHTVTGPAILGSPNVFVDGMPALRKTDLGMHAACCGPNMWTANAGSSVVFINGLAAHRKGDQDQHCGGTGELINGSPSVYVGD
ncbi:MAG: PAAR domain-containing protein [Syntrophaceae bacterium]